MQADRSSAACRAPLRARLVARLRAERGDTLIEVVIAALMVALIAAAILGGFADIGHLSADQRNEDQAAALAQQDQARLRGLTINQLSATGTGASYGNTSYSEQLDGTVYQVTSAAKFISGSTGSAACSNSGASGTADLAQTTSTVTWGTNSNGRTPVVVHGLITPTEGGSLVADATDPTGAGISGVTVSLSGGPSSVSPLTTDASGCAVFAGLSSGSYTVTFAPPTSSTWVLAPASGALTQSVTVTASQTKDVAIEIGQAASLTASFQTTYDNATVPATADRFTLSNGQLTPATDTFGATSTKTVSNFSSSVTGTGLYPFPSSEPSNYLYNAWAGAACAGEEPPLQEQAQAFSLTAGTNQVTIPEPAMIILPYTGTATQTPSYTQYQYDDTSSMLSYSTSTTGGRHPTTTSQWTANTVSGDYDNTETDSSTTGASMTVTLPLGTTSVTWVATEAKGNGIANVSIDGGASSSVDLYSKTTLQKVPVYTSPTLSATQTHTLEISVSGTMDSNASGDQISIDEIEYTVTSESTTYAQGPLMTTAPDVSVTETDSTCGDDKDYPPTQVPTATQGALVSPGLPYGNYSVCVDNGTNHVTLTVANTNFTAGTTVTADIYPGGTGYATGTCT